MLSKISQDVKYFIIILLILITTFSIPGFVLFTPLTLIFLALIARNHFSSSSPYLRFAIILFSGLITEFFAWYSEYIIQTENPALLHPLLGWDLLFGFGFYFGMAAGWALLTYWSGFTAKEAAIMIMIYGIFFEQNGAIFLTFNPILWLIVVIAYLPMVLPAFLLVPADKPSKGWKKYIAMVIVVYLGTHLFTWIILLLLNGNYPPPPLYAGI